MTYRVNTLGKAALIDRQLNGAYDIVEYVAQNLPFLMDVFKKLDSMQTVLDTYAITTHIENESIHLNQEQINAIEGIQSLITGLSEQGVTLRSIQSTISQLRNLLNDTSSRLDAHTEDETVHVTQEDKTRWNSIRTLTEQDVRDICTPIVQAVVDSIPDSLQVDSHLSDSSHNPVENQAITTELGNKVSRESIARVGFTGRYKDLTGIPEGDDFLDSNSTNWVQNKVITKAIDTIVANGADRITEEEIDSLFED